MRAVLPERLPVDAASVLGPDIEILVAPTDLVAALGPAEALCCTVAFSVSETLLAAAPRLRVVAIAGAGLDGVDLAAATHRGIVVAHTPDALTEATADLTFALLLAVTRRLVEGDALVRRGEFCGFGFDLLLGAELAGATLGIVGLGRIGRAVARRAAAFAMRILYAAPRPAPAAVERELGARRVALDELLAASDIVTLHCPLAAGTRHLIGSPELARFKRGAYLINTSRGALVEEEALVQALVGGRLAGAGLDVYEHEPRVHPRLLALPNVVLLPHIGSATVRTRRAMAAEALRSCREVLEGRRPPRVGNPEVYGPTRFT